MSDSNRDLFAAHVKACAVSREAEREARLARAAGRPVPVLSQAEVEAAVAASLKAAGYAASRTPKTRSDTPEGAVQAILDARALALGLRN